MEYKNEFQAFRMARLMIGHLHQTLKPEEKVELQAWLDTSLRNQQLFDEMVNQQSRAKAFAGLNQYDTLNAYRRFKKNNGHKRSKLWPRFMAAAAILVALWVGLWLGFKHDSAIGAASIAQQDDIAPGHNAATLTFEDGKVIDLNDQKNGIVVGNEKLTYKDGSDLATLPSQNKKGSRIIAATTKGQTYQITLPDQTKVWLNADSKIAFPSQFPGKERNVQLINGEVYFEVAKNKDKPFIVQTGIQKLEVLGTHFNINTYNDEANGTVTSLLEGAVKASVAGVSRVLKPGERVIGTATGISLLHGNANNDIAWKEGLFSFQNEKLETILKKIGRWYNVEVVYDNDALRNIAFGGTISRFTNVSHVLKKLELTDEVRFKLEGKKIIVTD